MAKTNQIKKLVNGEIADADDVNQIVENAGAEGGVIPYSPSNQTRVTNGTQSLGSAAYPWGSLFVNREAELVEVDPNTNTIASQVNFYNLRTFINQKDTPASYGGQSGLFAAVASTEDKIEFITSPIKSNVIFHWRGVDDDVVGTLFKDVSAFIGETPDASGYDYRGSQGTTPTTVLTFIFVKIPGITTITVHAKMWGRAGDANKEGKLDVVIGGQTATITAPQSTGNTPTWRTPADIDVSSLVDGTVYYGEVQTYNEDANEWGFVSGITLIAS